ncbi:MAG: hypothetical protein ACR5K4_01285 [Sodalis sp. (in: enterobacteria)]
MTVDIAESTQRISNTAIPTITSFLWGFTTYKERGELVIHCRNRSNRSALVL